MSKIDQVEDLQNLMTEIAQSLSMQRFIEQPALSHDQSKCNCMQYLFSCLKKDISKSLGLLDAYFQCMSEFYDFAPCNVILIHLKSVSDMVSTILNDIRDGHFDEEGGTENA